MSDAQLMVMYKQALQISHNDLDSYLDMLLQASKESLAMEGVTIDYQSYDDCNLVVLYAVWLYMQRLSGDEMPRMLRYKLNNRIFKEAITLKTAE